MTQQPNALHLLIVEWQTIKQQIAREVTPLLAKEMELRKAIMSQAFPNAVEGTNNLDLGSGYTLKGVKAVTYDLTNSDKAGWKTDEAIEAIEKLGNEGAFIAERLVKWKPSLSVTEYKALSVNDPVQAKIKALIDNALTLKDGAPTLEISAPKA